MAYIDKNLSPGEVVIYRTRLHWIVMLRPVLIAIVLAAAGMWLCTRGMGRSDSGTSSGLGSNWTITGAVFIAAAVLSFFIGLMRRNATEMAVSNQRVLIKSGIASRRTIEVLLPKIESIGVEEPAIGRMFGYGKVIVRGTGGTFETFSTIAHPNEFRQQVQQAAASVGRGATAPPR